MSIFDFALYDHERCPSRGDVNWAIVQCRKKKDHDDPMHVFISNNLRCEWSDEEAVEPRATNIQER